MELICVNKNYATKALALFFVLLMAFAVPASAAAEPQSVEPIEIRQYEIVTRKRLLADTGYSSNDVRSSTCEGAIGDISYSSFYGKETGAGSVVLLMKDDAQLAFQFDVVDTPDLLVKDITLDYNRNIPLEKLLEGTGYTADDISVYSINPILGSNSPGLYTYKLGQCQTIYNMNDGQIILFNVTVTEYQPTTSELFWNKMYIVFCCFVAAPFLLGTGLLVPPLLAFLPFSFLFLFTVMPVFVVLGIAASALAPLAGIGLPIYAIIQLFRPPYLPW